ALAIRQSEERRRSPQRRPSRDGERGLHHEGRGRARQPRATDGLGSQRRQRGAVLRRHGRPGACRHISGSDRAGALSRRPYHEGRSDLTPASLTSDAPEVFTFNTQTWEPKNYDDYDGEIAWRRALAMSRNLGTIHVGETVGFDKVAEVWKRVGVGTPPQGYPA